MASYQARQRDPLLDQNTQAALERRFKELLGAALVVIGVLALMLLGSYSPEDPSWMAVSDQPVHNWLGRIGAGIASPLFVIIGRGAWLLPVGLIVWGVRLILHRGEERLSSRVIFFPIGIALASVYAALLVPNDDWGQAFGLGGHFGDMVAGSLLGMSPVSGSIGLKLMSVLLAVATVAMGLFVLGFERAELRAIARFLMLGTAAAYAGVMMMLGRGAQASVVAAQAAAEGIRQRREEAAQRARELAEWEANQTAQANWADSYDQGNDPQYQYDDYAPAPAKGSLMSRIRRAVEPMDPPAEQAQLIDTDDRWHQPVVEETVPEDRIRARIARAVQTRAEAPMIHAEPEPAPLAAPRRAEMPVAEPAPVVSTPASVLAAVAKRLAGGARKVAQPAPPLRRAEPPLQARPRYMPGMAPVIEAAPEWHEPEEPVDAVEAWEGEPEIPPAPARRAAPEWVEEDDFDRNAFAALDEDDDGDEIPPLPSALAGTGGRAPGIQLDRRVIPPAPERRVVAPPKKAPAPSKQAVAEAQPKLAFETPKHPDYETPPLSLLTNPATIQRHQLSDEALEENARMLESVLDDYGVKGEIVSVRPGPVVTMYELEPAPGLKASRVIGLADDIARSMSALSARVSTVPGRSVIGIELPNAHREKVVLREILSARDFGDSNMRLPLALGKDIGGEPVIANLAKMPHLLIAGTTGSGKSVAINTMILSLLYKLSPEECRLIMIDPKMLELSVYDGIPHLLSPVVTDPKKAVVALKWVVGEMEERYRRMSKMGVRNIEGYNGRVREAMAKNEMFKRTVQTGFDEETGEPVFETEEFQPQPFPYIVVIVDEMADLMMVAGKEIEACIQRLAQMARASGIHLIMATQRPSVDVITGTIKANFPTRISFQVTSKIDSRTILGEQGAEQLLGMGDMLYMGTGSRITRIHGPFVSDEEVEEIVNHLKSFGPPEYMSGVVEGPDEEAASDIDAVLGLGGNTDGEDALYDQAVAIVIKDRKCSTSYIQRKLGIGYNKAARLVEQMEDEGVVSAANHVGKREILVPEQ
ncbi:DNA translocase FtsK [Paenirhodobacter populi]|uniref:DNA translocase FtsK n=1 Tax=Paenirhodobacter populi TaxID=2306993 RepID=A0A443IM44_9RHOB|nr:DNA translocase FtsK [Sinirhodobacter populi]RWR06312.1 cell division protein FtsK [Sinirhodobacter populi]